MKCKAPECQIEARKISGYCKRHYMQVYSHGKLRPELDEEKFSTNICMIGECIQSIKARHACATHYEQIRANKPLTNVALSNRACIIKDCISIAISKNCCIAHLQQYKRGVNFQPAFPWAKRNPCLEQNCKFPAYSIGYCRKHYMPHYNRRVGKSFSGVKPCIICGETRGTQRAHIIPQAEGGDWSDNNLLALCPTHHWCYDHRKFTPDETAIIVKHGG